MSTFYHFTLEQQVIALVKEAYEKRKTILNLSNFEISVIPTDLFSLKHIKKLYLNNNEVDDLSGISRLKSLTFLALDYNNLKELPKEIKHLASRLNSLNISYNPLCKILPEIGKLRALSVLWLNHCQLSELPPELGKLGMLDTFGARGNSIHFIPNDFCKLSQLRWLTLEENLIEDLPRKFRELTSLRHLNLKNNCFKVIPEEIKHLTDLKYCFLGNNDIKEVSRTFLKEVRHIVKLDLRGNKGLHFTTEMKIYRNVWIDENVLGFRMPDVAAEILEGTADVRSEEDEWEDVSLASSDEEWPTNDEESNDDEQDWEESLPSSELDLTELSDVEDTEQDDLDIGIIIPEAIANFIPSISCYIINGF